MDTLEWTDEEIKEKGSFLLRNHAGFLKKNKHTQ